MNGPPKALLDVEGFLADYYQKEIDNKRADVSVGEIDKQLAIYRSKIVNGKFDDWRNVLWMSRSHNFNYALLLVVQIFDDLTQEELDELLSAGVAYWNFDVVRMILSHDNVDVKCQTQFKYNKGYSTPLIELCEFDVKDMYNMPVKATMERMAHILLADGRIDVNAVDKYGETALFQACAYDKNTEDTVPLVRLLVEHGADPDKGVERVTNTSDGTPFHHYGQTPIMRALRNGDYELASYLLSTGKIRKITFKNSSLLCMMLRTVLTEVPDHHKHTRNDRLRAYNFLLHLVGHPDFRKTVNNVYTLGVCEEGTYTALELALKYDWYGDFVTILLQYGACVTHYCDSIRKDNIITWNTHFNHKALMRVISTRINNL